MGFKKEETKMTGRRKPTQLKIFEGNPGKRPLPSNEPKPEAKAPECPDDLCLEARKVWNRLAPTLERLGLLTEIDGDNFAALCQIRARLVDIHRKLKKEGMELIQEIEKVDKRGNLWVERRPNPYITLERQYFQLLRSYASEFGLTPRGRTGLTVGSTTGYEDGADLLS